MRVSTGSMMLFDLVHSKIQREGPLTFAAFMEEALYHPRLGYYSKVGAGESPAERGPEIGLSGDFFTAVSASPIFGRLLHAALASLWENELARSGSGRQEPLRIWEFGAHRGQLGRDLEQAFAQAGGKGGVQYAGLDAADEVPQGMRGCVLSNELMDAMPFHRLRSSGGVWRELYVGVKGPGRLDWIEGPVSDPRLTDALRQVPAEVMAGYEVEVSLRMQEWLCKVANRLEMGLVVTIDYGYDTSGYFAPSRPRGGLRCFRRHEVSSDPFAFVGEQDITADVDFGALIEAGEQVGLEVVEFVDQGRFLVRHAQAALLEIAQRAGGALSRERNALHLLTHPSMLGSKFKVLVQRKRQGSAPLAPREGSEAAVADRAPTVEDGDRW